MVSDDIVFDGSCSTCAHKYIHPRGLGIKCHISLPPWVGEARGRWVQWDDTCIFYKREEARRG